ncbi:MAG TPA: hypothetical protein VJG49_03855 [Candidatus Nanoarchaeia archaeon]|nr:hypothetical protein [Candidatus Nanoarchaeia archaeon]
MNLSIHFIVSAILAIVLYPVFGPLALIAMVGGFLIDVDHLFSYAAKFRSLNIKKAYSYHRNCSCLKAGKDGERKGPMIHIFHTLEFLVLCIALSFYSPLMLIFTLSLLIHLLLDLINGFFIFKRIKAEQATISTSEYYWNKLLLKHLWDKISKNNRV